MPIHTDEETEAQRRDLSRLDHTGTGTQDTVRQKLVLRRTGCLTPLPLFAHLLIGGNHAQPTGLFGGLNNTLIK